MIITAVLAWLHVFSAILWLGGGVMFGFVIAPYLAKLSPPGPAEFFVKIVPRVSVFFRVVAGTTILFGLLLFIAGVENGDFPSYSLSSAWGIGITIGMVFGILAFLNSEFVAQPPLKKAMKMFNELLAPGHQGPPSPDLPATLKRAALTARITVFLLILAMSFMIAAAYY